MKLLKTCLITLILAFSFNVQATNDIPELGKSIPPLVLPFYDKITGPNLTADKMINQVMDDAVVLQLGDRPFCSGQLAKDKKGVTHVYTAGHCCAVFDRSRVGLFAGGELNQVITSEGYSLYIGGLEYAPGVDACKMEVVSKNWYDFVTPLIKYDVKTKIAPVGFDTQLFMVSPFPAYDISQRIKSFIITGYELNNPKHRTVTARFFPGQSGSAIVNHKGELVGHAVAIFMFQREFTSIISILDETPFLEE